MTANQLLLARVGVFLIALAWLISEIKKALALWRMPEKYNEPEKLLDPQIEYTTHTISAAGANSIIDYDDFRFTME